MEGLYLREKKFAFCGEGKFKVTFEVFTENCCYRIYNEHYVR